MANNTTSGRFNPSALGSDLATAWRLMWSPQMPTALKVLIPAAAMIYWFSPIDLLPGLPFDDIALMILALKMFVQLAPDAAKNPNGGPNAGATAQSAQGSGGSSDAGGDVVDTTWTIVED